jgi:hypothetical protein
MIDGWKHHMSKAGFSGLHYGKKIIGLRSYKNILGHCFSFTAWT